MYKKFLILIVLLSSILSSGNVENFYFSLYNEDLLSFIIKSQYDSENNEVELFSSKNPVDNISLSPNNKYISFLVNEIDDVSRNKILYVMNINGYVIKKIKNVYRTAWDIDTNRIAYIEGNSYEGGMGYNGNSVKIYNINTNTIVNIDKIESSFLPYDLFWANHDNNLYIFTPKQTYLYKITNDSLSICEFKGIYYSYDGKYCYYPSYEGDKFILLDTHTLKQISINSIYDSEILFPLGWIENSHYIVIHDYKLNKYKAICVNPLKEIIINFIPDFTINKYLPKDFIVNKNNLEDIY